jgi:uncharacterized membrane protein
MPRTWVTQAAMSALCTAIGIALGTVLGDLLKAALRAADRPVRPPAVRQAWRVVGPLGLGVVVLGAVLWPRWQTDQRRGVSLDPLPAVQAVPMVILTAVLLVVLVVIGRLVGRGVRRTYRALDARLPRFVATPVTVVLVLVLAIFVFRDVLAANLTAAADASFSVVDTGTREGTERPTEPTSSGSPDSLVEWDDLGYQGREFAAGATTAEELAEYHGTDAELLAPIRAYVGLRSADSPEERAALAVRELERTEAFDREVLVVITVTGSGWVDPDAAVAIEQMYAGDTALVAQQYSYLPSWIAALMDPTASVEASSALFEAVHERWEQEPEATRPQLVVFGQSLGSYGAEAAFAGPDARASVANLVARTEGALFTGPTKDNLIWNQLVDAREAGSPVWLPVYDGGRHVRFANRDPEVPPLDPSWDEPRIFYIQHPTDPVTFWNIPTLWRSPEWMDHPRGIGVPDRGRWFPVVTFTQGIFDLMAGFGAPPGYGHDYRLDFVAGWATVAPPEGWDASRTEALQDFLRGR